MLKTMEEYIRKEVSFVFETTLAGKIYARKIQQWQIRGYHISLLFLRLESVEVAIDRVAERVKQGGHHIPENVIKRRFYAGWTNFKNLYSPLVDSWAIYDNDDELPVLVEWSEKNESK